jgi:D-alanine-D-alanine ligase
MESKRRIRLGILFGGRSGEHEVSLSSAASVITALDPERFEITAIGIAKTGKLASVAEVRQMLPIPLHARVRQLPAAAGLVEGSWIVPGVPDDAHRDENHKPEVIFPLLHGPFGEDGTIQGLLEVADLPYLGCGVLASAAGMDKDVMKRLFVQAGFPTLPYLSAKTASLGSRIPEIREEAEAAFGYPMFSKPANLGSSVGVVKIHGPGEFEVAVRLSAQFDSKILIEKGVDARELECAILGNDEPEASGVGEIIPSREFYDYEAKYDDPDSRVEIPAQIPDSTTEEIRRIAIGAFQCIDGSGLARVDFFLERDSGKVWLNEINTMPGFTPISMYPKLWAARGLSFEDLVVKLVDLAMDRFEQKKARRIS